MLLALLLPLLVPAQEAAAPLELRLERTERGVRVLAGGELFTVYREGEAEKPFLYPLLAPGGVAVTRAYPMEERAGEQRDHPHQRSVWFAHGDVNGHDFWHAGAERIVADGEPELDEGAATVRAKLRWLAPDDELVCTEARTMRFHAWPDRRAIDFELCLRAPAERPLTFGDTKEGTFGVRLAAPLRLAGEVAAGHSLSSEGRRDGECWGRRARWMTYWGPIDEDVVGVALFDHPRNPAHPTRWHARDYGLFAANPFGLHDFEGAPEGAGALTVPAGGELVFRYRLLVYQGAAEAARLEAQYREYAGDESAR